MNFRRDTLLAGRGGGPQRNEEEKQFFHAGYEIRLRE
jgi:hypothetical protein